MTEELINSDEIAAPPLAGDEELVIGILLCNRPVLRSWVDALCALRSPMKKGVLVKRSPGVSKMQEIMTARRRIVERSMQIGARWLFFLDDDVLVAPNTLEELLAAMRSNQKARIIGGIYYNRGNVGPDVPGVWDEANNPLKDFPRGRPFKCGGVANGCMLIDLRVFDELSKPWFNYELRRGASGGIGVHKGEDVLLCDAVRGAGYEVLAHGGIICPHLDARIVASDFKGKSPWELRYFKGEHIDAAGNTLLKSQAPGAL
jgi:Glycosyl transferase family 2